MEFQPKSPEEIERTMQFLLAQQTQFAANSAASELRMDRNTEDISRLTLVVDRVVDSVARLAEAQIETNTQVRVTQAGLNELRAFVQTVDVHLNVVIEMFERHLREDHGHRPS